MNQERGFTYFSFLYIKEGFLLVVEVLWGVCFASLFAGGTRETHQQVFVQRDFQAEPLLEEPRATNSSQLSIY